MRFNKKLPRNFLRNETKISGQNTPRKPSSFHDVTWQAVINTDGRQFNGKLNWQHSKDTHHPWSVHPITTYLHCASATWPANRRYLFAKWRFFFTSRLQVNNHQFSWYTNTVVESLWCSPFYRNLLETTGHDVLLFLSRHSEVRYFHRRVVVNETVTSG